MKALHLNQRSRSAEQRSLSQNQKAQQTSKSKPRLPKAPGLRSTNAAQLVAGAIREGSLMGRYAPGQRLVEADLMKEFGISRSSIREALQSLASEGWIDLIRNRGATMRKLDRDEVDELLQIREMLEGFAAALAAKKIHIGNNRKLLAAAAREVTDISRNRRASDYGRANLNFHQTILDLSGNPLLMALGRQAQVTILTLRYRVAEDAETRPASVADHVQITKAILAGDTSAAEKAMRTHVRRTRAMLRTMPAFLF